MTTRRKGQMAESMRRSLDAEEQRLQARFEKAEAIFGKEDAFQEEAAEPVRVIRDTFTMPPDDHALLDKLRARALANGQIVNKSELVRAGLRTLHGFSEADFRKVIAQVEKVKPGRPK